MATQRDFQEWMVTRALAAYLKEDMNRAAWLFDLEADTLAGNRTAIADLCGFQWKAGSVMGEPESVLKLHDRGDIPEAEFRKIFLWKTADLRYWTEDRKKQLIVEAKGTATASKSDSEQAKRYFEYLRVFPAKGAVVYFVPNPASWNWLKWLDRQAKESGVTDDLQIRFGVVNMNTQIVPKVARELVHVVGKALVQNAQLLDIALQFRPEK